LLNILNQKDGIELTALEKDKNDCLKLRKFYLSVCVGGSDAAVNERCVGRGKETLMFYRDEPFWSLVC